MINIVKLILVCQIKDKEIPQLIPLFWIISSLILLGILFSMILVFRIRYSLIYSLLERYREQNNFVWCW